MKQLAVLLMLLLLSAASAANPPEPATTAEEPEATEPDEDDEVPATPLVERVEVTTTRAREGTPVTFTNLSRERIDQEYWAQDLPALLRGSPSVYSYSDAGNDIGYSYLRIRGFDQKRIAVTINGVPLNDAESHDVFWIDLPNFPDSLQDIQVQRGVGSALYGANAIGGTVNLETARAVPGEGWRAEVGYGSYGTSKLTVGWTSDLVADRWVFSGRLSRIATDGYRAPSWTRMGMGFFTAQRFGERSTLRINLYGGLEESLLAYEGSTREQLRDDRRANPQALNGERDLDHFSQPHFEVIHEWHPSDRLDVGNTFYYFYGDGYFDQFRPLKSFYDVRLADWDWDGDGTDDSRGPLARRRQVEEWDAGWVPRVTWKHANGTLTGGAEIRLHQGHHFGEVSGAVPPGTPSDFRYYDYEVPKESYVLYLQEEWQVTDRLTLLTALQRVDHSWELEHDKVTGYHYDVSYDWISPRIGFGYDFNDRLSGFVSLSRARREPAVRDLVDLQDVYSTPSFRHIDDPGHLADPIPVEEKLTDLELGLGYTSEDLVIRATAYHMSFKDEIVYLGAFNDNWDPITANADESVHRGLELEWAGRLAPRWTLAGNLMLADDELKDFKDFDPDIWGHADVSGNRIAWFPDVLGHLAITWKPAWGRLELGAFHAGRIYLDNFEDRERSTDPYTLLHLASRWPLPVGGGDYSLELRINNLLDEKYESFGYVDIWDEDRPAFFFPGAGANAFVTLSYRPSPRS